MQIIAGALAMGIVIFFGIVMYLVYGGGNPQPAPADTLPAISFVACAMLLTTGPLSFVVPAMTTQNSLKQIAASGERYDVSRLIGLKQANMIISMALLEGPAFCGLIAFLVERQPAVLAVPAVALAGILMQFPTENGVRNWTERQGRRIEEMRQNQSRS
jgi:hypothetical protein